MTLLQAAVLLTFSASRYVPSAGEVATAVGLLPFAAIELHGTAWSLQNEIFFYLIFGVLILNRRVGLALLTTWIVVCIACAFGDPSDPDIAATSFFNVEFLFGMAAAVAFRRFHIVRPTAWLFLGLLAFGTTAACEVMGLISMSGVAGRLCYGLASSAIVLGMACRERCTESLQLPWLARALGEASYSLYLIHLSVFLVLLKIYKTAGLMNVAPAPILFLGMVSAAVAIALLFSRHVEHRLIALTRRGLSSLQLKAPRPYDVRTVRDKAAAGVG
jgi:exopolysaccharide production protein ExoZ